METPPREANPGSDADRINEQLVRLAKECPYTGSNPPTCPLHEVRKLDPETTIGWLNGLAGEEKEFLMLYHDCCVLTHWERDWANVSENLKLRAGAASSCWTRNP